MENCLKKQLNGSVNKNLPVFESILLDVKAVDIITNPTKQQAFQVRSTSSVEISVLEEDENNYFALSAEDLQDTSKRKRSYTVPAYTTQDIYVANSNFTLKLKGKYNLTVFSLLSGAAINSIISFNLSDISHSTKLTNMQYRYSDVEGKLKDFALLTLINGEIGIVGSNKITGSIEELANGQVEAGRTSGTMRIYSNSVITLNGSVVGPGQTKYIKFGSDLPSGAEATGTGWAVYATNPD